MSAPEGTFRREAPESRNAERLKFFTDAVVAIAMTLLILPLLEGVTEAARAGEGTTAYFDDHGSQLFAFVLSFVIIASFWVGHERLFTFVGSWTGPLMVLNIGWMLTIVFLPVVTALVGTMETDRPQIAVYVGTMLLSSLLMAAMSTLVRRDPRVWADDVPPGPGGLAASLSLAILFGLALVVGMVAPGVNYLALFLLFLTGPLQRVLGSALSRGPRTRR